MAVGHAIISGSCRETARRVLLSAAAKRFLHAAQVAKVFGLTLHQHLIDPASIEEALAQVLAVIPKIDPVNALRFYNLSS
jgi:hypothetical protein